MLPLVSASRAGVSANRTSSEGQGAADLGPVLSDVGPVLGVVFHVVTQNPVAHESGERMGYPESDIGIHLVGELGGVADAETADIGDEIDRPAIGEAVRAASAEEGILA